MRKSYFNVEFLVLFWPIISRFFACSSEEKTITTKGACSSPISMSWTTAIAELVEHSTNDPVESCF